MSVDVAGSRSKDAHIAAALDSKFNGSFVSGASCWNNRPKAAPSTCFLGELPREVVGASWLLGWAMNGFWGRSYGFWRLIFTVSAKQCVREGFKGTYESRPGFLVLATSLPSSSTLYRRNANTRLWKGWNMKCEPFPRQPGHHKQTHLRHESRAGMPAGRRKIDGRWESVLGCGHGCISVSLCRRRHLAHFISRSGGATEQRCEGDHKDSKR